MRGLVGLVGVLVVIALLVKYWWVVAIGAIIAAAIYLIVKYGRASAASNQQERARTPTTARPRTTSRAATRPAAHQPASGLRFVDAPTPAPYFERQSARPVRVRSIATTDLTRRPTGYPTSGTVFTAVDLETTGLDCEVDQIVEIGLVKFTADGRIVDEFATLVNNPGSCREARNKHQINDDDLIYAPSTGDTLREAFAFMAGTVLVAHKFDFEEGFLSAAARRERIPLPPVLGVCTLQTSRRQLDGRAYSLTVMYKTATGEFPTNQHTALGDARAIREILLWLLANAPAPLHFMQAPPGLVSKCRRFRVQNELSPSAFDEFIGSRPAGVFPAVQPNTCRRSCRSREVPRAAGRVC